MSELHSMISIEYFVQSTICSFYTGHPFCSSIRVLSKEVTLQSIHSFIIHVSSYMFRLYIHCHHQAGYGNLNRKIIIINTITHFYCIAFLLFGYLRYCGTVVVQLIEVLRYGGGAFGWGTLLQAGRSPVRFH